MLRLPNALLPAIVMFLVSCTMGASSSYPASHFAFPNSNVVPIGRAKGSHTRLCGLLVVNWGAPDGDDQEEATLEALNRSGGDILINVRSDNRIFMVPYLFTLCMTKVQGTAARMEVGRQELEAYSSHGRGQARPASRTAHPPVSGCASDVDCKLGRVCRDARCVYPEARRAPSVDNPKHRRVAYDEDYDDEEDEGDEYDEE